MIEINNLHKSFGQKKVLDGVTLTIPDGETMCIIGKSGCGKSVLLKHIVGLLTPDQGFVNVDGKTVANLSYKEIFDLRLKMGFVFQGSALFDSSTVYENVVIGLYEHGQRDEKKLEQEAIRVLSAVGLLPEINGASTSEFDKEWSILKNKKPSDLSGGMKKRVGVARALVGQPSYIFYDEPTTGLHFADVENLLKALFQLRDQGNTILVIEHQLDVIKMADYLIDLGPEGGDGGGRVVATGTPEEVAAQPDSYTGLSLKKVIS